MAEGRWYKKRENILISAGLGFAVLELIHAEFLGGTFHPEFLIFAGGLCGLGFGHKGDKNES